MSLSLRTLTISIVLLTSGFLTLKYAFKEGYRGKILGPAFVLVGLIGLYKVLIAFLNGR